MISSAWVRCSFFNLLLLVFLAIPASGFSQDYYGGGYDYYTYTYPTDTPGTDTYNYDTYANDPASPPYDPSDPSYVHPIFTNPSVGPFPAPVAPPDPADMRVACSGFWYNMPTENDPSMDYTFAGCTVVHPDECQTLDDETPRDTSQRLFITAPHQLDYLFLEHSGHSYDEELAEAQCRAMKCEHIISRIENNLAERRRELEEAIAAGDRGLAKELREEIKFTEELLEEREAEYCD